MSWVDLRRRSHDPESAILKDLIKTKILDEAQDNTPEEIEHLVPVLITSSQILKQKLFFAGLKSIAAAQETYIPREPDGKYLRLWIKNEHGGNYLTDHSKCDNIVEQHAELNEETGNSIEPTLRLVGSQDYGIIPNTIAQETTGLDNQYIQVLDNPNIRLKEIFNTSSGFTIFCRIAVAININETLTGTRSTLFSKIDTEQVDYGYMAQLSDDGSLHFFVRHEYIERYLSCADCIAFQLKDDYIESDFNKYDFRVGPKVTKLPFNYPVTFQDFVFTFDFATKVLNIIRDGELMASGGTILYQPISNLQAFWRLTEGQGYATVTDPINSNTGTLNGPLWQTDNTLLFDGAANRYITIPNSNSLNNFTALSISAWVYPRSLPDGAHYPTIISKHPYQASVGGGFQLYLDHATNNLVMLMSPDGVNYPGVTFTNAFPVLNQWYHVVFTWSSGSTMKLYVNNSAATVGSTVTTTMTNAGAILIGNCDNSLTVQSWDGKISYLQVYNKALSTGEIATLFNQGRAEPVIPTSPFPVYQRDPPAIGGVPQPVTNPQTQFYNQTLPAPADQDFTKLHVRGFTGLNQFYNVGDGAAHTGAGTFQTPITTVYNVPSTADQQTRGIATTPTYNVPDPSSSSHVQVGDGTNIRAGIHVAAGSTLIGKVLARIVLRMRKVQTPTGTLKCFIRKAAVAEPNNFIQFGSNVDVATIPTSDTTYTFDLVSNTYALAVDDRIVVEYTPPAGQDNSNYVDLRRDSSAPVANSDQASFDTAWKTNTSYDVCGQLYEVVVTNVPSYQNIWYGGGTSPQVTDAIYVNSPSSPLVGKIITSATFTVMKNSATALTGTFGCEIYKANGGFVTLGTIQNCSSVTQTAQTFTFTDRNQTYALVNGDKVRIKVHSGNTTSTDYIMVNHTLSDAFTGANESVGDYTNTYTNVPASDIASILEAGGNTINDPSFNPWVSLNDVNKRVVMWLDPGSLVIGKVITRVVAHLSKTGNPQGTISCHIRTASNDSIFATMGFADIGPLTSTPQAITFTNTNNTLAVGTNDRISLEYTQGDANNYVNVHVQLNMDAPNQNIYDGTKTRVKTYNGSSYVDTISSRSSNGYDLAGELYTGGGISDPAGRIRSGMKCNNSTSIIKGKKPTKAVVYLQKVGTISGTDDIAVRIRKGTDDSIAATLGLLSSSAISTSSPTAYTVTNLGLQYAIQVGDKLTVEFSGGSDTNYIKSMCTKSDTIDSTKTHFVEFDGVSYTDWTNLDFIGELWSGGDTYVPASDEIPIPRNPFYTHDLCILAGGQPWSFSPMSQMNPIGQNILADFRFERQVFTTQMATNLKLNGCSTTDINPGQVSKVEYFATTALVPIILPPGNFESDNYDPQNFDTTSTLPGGGEASNPPFNHYRWKTSK
jgi:hypothetical protein